MSIIFTDEEYLFQAELARRAAWDRYFTMIVSALISVEVAKNVAGAINYNDCIKHGALLANDMLAKRGSTWDKAELYAGEIDTKEIFK